MAEMKLGPIIVEHPLSYNRLSGDFSGRVSSGSGGREQSYRVYFHKLPTGVYLITTSANGKFSEREVEKLSEAKKIANDFLEDAKISIIQSSSSTGRGTGSTSTSGT